MENGVVFDAADKTVECLRLNTKSAVKAFRVVNSPVVEKMELGRFWYGQCRVDRDAKVRFSSVLPEFHRTQNRTLCSVQEILPNVEPDHWFRFGRVQFRFSRGSNMEPNIFI